MNRPSAAPDLSVVVVLYQMSQQIGNTIRSLTFPYQRLVDTRAYEVILIDNGSPEPLPREVWNHASNIRYHYVSPEDASPNPGVAVNLGVQLSRAPILCLMIDGARMVTPGVLGWGLKITRFSPSTIAEVRGWHLGPKNQVDSIREGYTHEVERELLKSVGWWENGYRLFDISHSTISSRFGFSGRVRESNCIFMHRSLFNSLGGYDERYRHPGGGLVNVDFFRRAVSTATTVFTLLGEGNFHQVHGGASTGLVRPMRAKLVREWRAEYERLSRPVDPNPPEYDPILVGHIPKECARFLIPDEMT